jgi:hypothetical protein
VVLMNLQVIMGAMIHRISPSRPSTVFNWWLFQMPVQ